MIVSAWKAFWRQFGFYKEPPVVNWLGKSGLVNVAGLTNADAQFAADWQWQDASFYTEEKRRNERLAQIARERAWLYENKADLIAKKKGFYVRLRALKNAEMAVEQGKPEPGK